MLLVLTTVDSEEAAKKLARELLQRRLVACVQIQPIQSIYRWEGKVQEDAEWRLLLKTTESAFDALQAALLQLHPYDLPALVAVPVEKSSDAFDAWVVNETSP